MPWHFVRHYLPKDDSSSSNDREKILPLRKKRVVTQYCHHRNATLDTLVHLLKWSKYDIDWVYLTGNNIEIRNQEILEYLINRYQAADGDKDDFLISLLVAGNVSIPTGYGLVVTYPNILSYLRD
ncbi:hypothetical protein DFA_10107 [Cavenderia fasciculata]|uniref:Uncharacterized protein n=1 Tax=Cavenderia fasciculata TaxID=261658 RepID=F4Q9A4_CACFS|nr:uncharacterized protein DFA_10107 [Cavenderia fasciculata]EGG15273.1 hypothetical protein DFA_10107 [Cavenderia fasciculata]|eukprot:XP_004351993.1 hypothetical protein DFA_10107 [Cavenderia fasciculata]